MDHDMTLVRHDIATSTLFQRFCHDKDIALKISAPSKQWQNGVAERTGGRTVYEHATAMLFDSGLNVRWWPFAVAHYVMVSNCISVKALGWKTPFEAHYGFKPFVGHLRRFGCPAFVHKNKEARVSPAAFTSRVHRCIHLGNAVDSTPGVYLLFDLSTKALIKSADVYLDEQFRLVKKGASGWIFDDALLNSKYESELFHQSQDDSAKITQLHIRHFDPFALSRLPFGDDPPVATFDTTNNLEQVPISRTSARFQSSVSSTAKQPVQLAPGMKISYHWKFISPGTTPVWAEETLQRQATFAEDMSTIGDIIPLSEQWRTQDTNGFFSILWLPQVHFACSEIDSWKLVTAPSVTDVNVASGCVTSRVPCGKQSNHVTDVLAHSAVETLASLFIQDHYTELPFQSASSLMPSNPMGSFLSRRFVTTAALSVTSLFVAAAVTPNVQRPRPPVFKGTLHVDWSKTSKQVKQFAVEHGDDNMRLAFTKEMTGLIDAGVLSEPVELPHGQIAPMAFMLLSLKADGITFKGRCVYRGDKQIEGINYNQDELYAPVMDRTSFRVLIAIGAAHCAHIHTMDVNLAFLYGDMPDEIYMAPPAGIYLALGKVWRVLKSLYGTKQAPAIWHAVLKSWFLSYGLTATSADPCVFEKRTGTDFLFVGVHVDDLLIVTTSDHELAAFKTAISIRFSLKDQGSLDGREFTGCYVEYDRSQGSARLSCDRSVAKLLDIMDCCDMHPHSTPLAKQNGRDTTPAYCNFADRFGTIAGHANWLSTLCRPDLSTASSLLSSCDWKNPTKGDVKDAKRLLRYLRGTLSKHARMGLSYCSSGFKSIILALTPVSFVDSDHAGDPTGGPLTKRSRSGQIIFLCGAPIYWASALQKTVAISTTYAEIIALSDICKKVVWLVALLGDLGFPQGPVPVWEDNQPCIDIVSANRMHKNTRHYEIRYMWCKELVERQIIDLRKIDSYSNMADYFTKILSTDDTLRFIRAFMHRPLHSIWHPTEVPAEVSI
jgi:hypothetical protein